MNIVEVGVRDLRVLQDFHLDLANHRNNIIFINGSNGRGKTTLLLALRWCFFAANINPRDFSWASRKKVESTGEGSIEVFVKFALASPGDFAIIRRVQSVRQTAGSDLEFTGNSVLTVTQLFADTSKPSLVHPRPEEWLADHLPERFEKFILFDGELMYKFFDVSVKGAIENAVREIANIDVLEEVVQSLQSQLGRLNSRAAKLSGANAERLNLGLSEAMRVHDAVQRNLKTAIDSVESLKSARERYSSELKGYESAARFLETNKRLREELASVDLIIRDYDNRLNKAVFETGIASLILSRVRYPLDKHIRTAEEAGRYPADFQPRALQQLLDKKECLCGRPLEKPSPEYSSVFGVIETSVNSGELGRELQAIDRGVASSAAVLSAARRTMKTTVEDFKRATADRSQILGELEKIEPKLEGVRENEAHIQDMARRLKVADNEFAEAVRQVEILKFKSDEALRDIVNARSKFQKAMSNSSEAEVLKRKVDFLEAVIAQAMIFNGSILESVRLRLERFVAEEYSKIKRGHFSTKITEDFEILTFNDEGIPVTLSEGETMIKAYIFSIALRQVVGLKFPLIVDTPYGRLDEANRELITNTLASLASITKEHQLIFMMHSAEYSPFSRDDFAKSSPFESYLAWNQDSDVTSLERGIDPEWLKFGAWKDWHERNKT